MNDIKQLFFHLTPSTLAAIVADLDGHSGDFQTSVRELALDAGYDNCGDEFTGMLDAARNEADGDTQRAEDLTGSNGTVAAILARQS